MLSTFDLRGRMKLCSRLLERGCVPGSLCGSRRGRAKQGGEERAGKGRENGTEEETRRLCSLGTSGLQDKRPWEA